MVSSQPFHGSVRRSGLGVHGLMSLGSSRGVWLEEVVTYVNMLGSSFSYESSLTPDVMEADKVFLWDAMVQCWNLSV